MDCSRRVGVHTGSTQLIIQNRELDSSTQVTKSRPRSFVMWPDGRLAICSYFSFGGFLCHSAQQQEGKCGSGFSHFGDNAGEARWERSSILQETEGSLTSLSSSDEKGATS